MNWYKIGALIWTACAAGWAVLAYVTGMVECGIVALACLGMAAFFNEFGN